MAYIEEGVLRDFKRWGITEPYSARQALALEVARTLDVGVEEKNFAALSRELRLTLIEIENEPRTEEDAVERLMHKD